MTLRKGEVTIVMETTVKSKAIRVYQAGDVIRYRMDINTAIAGIVVRNGEYVREDITHLDFHPSVLVAQVLALVPGVDILYTKKKEAALRSGSTNGFGAAELQVVLRDAELKIERTEFIAGEEYDLSDGTKGVHEHDGYTTSILDIKVSDKVQVLLDKVIDSVFSF